MVDQIQPDIQDRASSEPGRSEVESGVAPAIERLKRVEDTLRRLDRVATVREVPRIEPGQRVRVWFLGVVLASLTPLFGQLFASLDGGKSPDVYKILGRGDLLAFSFVFTLAAIVELGSSRRRSELPVGLLIFAVILILAEGMWYGNIASALASGTAIPARMVTVGSIVCFGLSTGCSLRCIQFTAGG